MPAEILKAGNLRTCSFGFDWSRSGSFHLSEFLRLPLLDFLVRHVYHPNIPLYQSADPTNLVSQTSEPAPLKPVYGYNYFLNPHRNITSNETQNYHYRCFDRLRTVLSANEVNKVFVLADYHNKPYSEFLHEPTLILYYLDELLTEQSIHNYQLCLIKIRLNDDVNGMFNLNTHFISNNIRFHSLSMSRCLDEPIVRVHAYRLIADRIFHRDNRQLILWKPL